jgi:hypothetical protein
MRRAVTAILGIGLTTAATAGEPARVAEPTHLRAAGGEARIGRAVPKADTRLRLDDPDGRLRRGVGGTIVEMRPFADSRFHLAAGGRLFGRSRANRGIDERDLLAAPRGTGGRPGGRRFAPAFLMGVDERIAGRLSLGLDAGVVMGPAMDRGIRGGRGMVRNGRDGLPGTNRIARLTLGLHF